jgi:polyphenol oxidase
MIGNAAGLINNRSGDAPGILLLGILLHAAQCVTLMGVLQRRGNENGLVYYSSEKLERLGVRHAFSTRIGGISPPPFDSLNLGNPNGSPVQDDYARIWSNYGRLTSSIGCGIEPPLRVHQVHGREVATVESSCEFDTDCKADALVSRDWQRVISVRTADCVPVLLCSGDGRTVAAVHAGWRGIVAGVIPAAMRRMLDVGKETSADEFVAAIGPCIGQDAFEVGPEVLAEFTSVFGSEAPIAAMQDGKGTVDLRRAARMQLLGAGLRGANVDSTDRCTVTHREEFFSHRRERGITGRMAAVIAANRS